jgi:hypothetical protein
MSRKFSIAVLPLAFAALFGVVAYLIGRTRRSRRHAFKSIQPHIALSRWTCIVHRRNLPTHTLEVRLPEALPRSTDACNKSSPSTRASKTLCAALACPNEVLRWRVCRMPPPVRPRRRFSVVDGKPEAFGRRLH